MSLSEEKIRFLIEEQSQLWEEVRHNDRLRWLLFAGWILAQAWLAGSIINSNGVNNYRLSLLLLLVTFLIGPLVMCFHALERNKSSEFFVAKDIIRSAIFEYSLTEKPPKRKFITAWKGTDGIYTYLLTASAIVSSSFAIYKILENLNFFDIYLMIVCKIITLIFILFVILHIYNFILNKKLSANDKKNLRLVSLILAFIVYSIFSFIFLFCFRLKISYLYLYLFIPFNILIHLITYACIIHFGTSQYGKLSRDLCKLLDIDSNKLD